MRNIIGDNWKILTGAEQPVYTTNTSPGYRHELHWQSVMDRISKLSINSNIVEEMSTGAMKRVESLAITETSSDETPGSIKILVPDL
eukprot:gene51047-68333_t